MLPPILAIFARLSKPLWINIRSTGVEVTGRRLFSNGCSCLNASLSQVPRPRPRPRLEGSKTKTKTRGFQDQDQDSEVPRPRSRPRLEGSKTKIETKTCKNESRDQDSSLENSKSGKRWPWRQNDQTVGELPSRRSVYNPLLSVLRQLFVYFRLSGRLCLEHCKYSIALSAFLADFKV